MSSYLGALTAGTAAATLEDEERRRRYAAARAFWDGTQWEGWPRRNETRLTFNYARTLLRKAVSYMFSAPVTFNVLEPQGVAFGRGTEAAQQAERVLARLLSDLDADTLDFGLAEQASVLGDAAAKVTWDAEAGTPRLAAVDPAGLEARWAAGDPRRPTWVRHEYEMTGAEAGEAFGTPGLAARRAYHVAETWTDVRWTVEVGRQPAVDGENPYGWIPYVVVANEPEPTSLWGRSDLEDLYDACRQLNRRLSVVADILDLAGYPIAVLENVDGTDGIAVGPGARWELPEGARAYLLDLLESGGVGLHIQYIDQVRTALHDLAETPRTAFGDSGRTLSGSALEVEIQPLVQRVRRKRRAFDGFYRARNARLLDLAERFGGMPVAGLRRTQAVWPQVLPSDDEQAVAIETALVGSGLRSLRTAMTRLGEEDAELELRRIVEEARMRREGELDVGPGGGAAAGAGDGERGRVPGVRPGGRSEAAGGG